MGIKINYGPVRKDGRKAVILQYYYGTTAYRETLNKYVFAFPKSKEEKAHNNSVAMFAEGVRLRRLSERENGDIVGSSYAKSQLSFIQYFKKLTDETSQVKGLHSTWVATYNHLKIFANGKDIRFNECDEGFLLGFKKYLLSCKGINRSLDLSNNSATTYFSKVKAALNRAVADKIIKDTPGSRVKNIKLEDTSREFLSKDEIGKLFKLECELPLMRKAFLFSCLTGLRWSDVKKLKWGEIRSTDDENVFRLHFKQQKTKAQQYHPIGKAAVALLGKFGNPEDEVFKNLNYTARNNEILLRWVEEAGINRHITFHCARHSYAILMLISTNNPYTVSKLLGHKDIKTTLIYLKMLNDTANKAVHSFPNFSEYHEQRGSGTVTGQISGT